MTQAIGTAIKAEVKDFIAKPRTALINGKWVPAKSGETFDVFNPATGELLARVAACAKEDVDLAVAAARKAFDDGPWSKMTPSTRGKIIWKIGDLILENLDELAQLDRSTTASPSRRAADVRGGPLSLHGGLGDEAGREHDRSPFPMHQARNSTRSRGANRSASSDRSFRGTSAADGGLGSVRRSRPAARSCSRVAEETPLRFAPRRGLSGSRAARWRRNVLTGFR
jgi:hypothetical protein